MAGSVNKVIILGRLGADPEVRTFQNGGKVCNLRVATSETWKDRNTGEKQARTQWHSGPCSVSRAFVLPPLSAPGRERASTEVVPAVTWRAHI